MQKIKFDRQKLINSTGRFHNFLCVTKNLDDDERYPSFWYRKNGDEVFSTLRGSHDIKRDGDGYYNHYHKETFLKPKTEKKLKTQEITVTT